MCAAFFLFLIFAKSWAMLVLIRGFCAPLREEADAAAPPVSKQEAIILKKRRANHCYRARARGWLDHVLWIHIK